jgi:hypothetical protein
MARPVELRNASYLKDFEASPDVVGIHLRSRPDSSSRAHSI